MPNIFQPAQIQDPNQKGFLSQSAFPASLQGTMTGGQATPSPTPSSVPQTTAGAVSGPAATGGMGAGAAPSTIPIGAFGTAMNELRSKLAANEGLNAQKAALLRQVYERPLTEEERRTLTPSQQNAIMSNNRGLIDLEVRLINDTIQGRANTLDSGIKYLTDTYQQDIQNAENQRQKAIDNVLNFAQVYGSQAKAALTSLYGQEYVDQLKGMGIDIDSFASQATLAQQKQYSDGAGGYELSDSELKALDSSPQGKSLYALGDLKRSAQEYQSLLDDYGYEFKGKGKNLLESAYADLKVKWKEAANLGALTGPDLELIMDAVKPATGIRGLGSLITGGGTEGIKGSVGQLLERVDREGANSYENLLKRNKKYGSSQYVKALGQPFGGNSLKEKVTAAGYDYDQMRADGFSDEEIAAAIGE